MSIFNPGKEVAPRSCVLQGHASKGFDAFGLTVTLGVKTRQEGRIQAPGCMVYYGFDGFFGGSDLG